MERSEHIRFYEIFLIVLAMSILSLLSAVCINAQETSNADGDKGSDRISKHIDGLIEHKFFGHFRKAKQDPAQYAHELIMRFDVKYSFRKDASIVLTPIIRIDNRHFTAGVIDRLQETEDRRYHLNFKEAFLAMHGRNADIYLGKKIYSWGKAEGFNPTDSINPYDFLDFLDREKIGVLSAAVEYSLGDYSIDIVFIPFFTPSRLPGHNNRWAGSIERKITAYRGAVIPPSLSGKVHERELPAKNLGNSQFAGRVRTTISGWDIAVSYYRGFDSVPVIEKTAVGVGPVYHYTLKYNEINKYGLAVATTFDKLKVHAEAAYRDTAKGYDDDFLAYIIGGSYSWDDIGLEFVEKVSLYFEFAGEKVINAKTSTKRLSATDYSRPLKKSVLGSLVFKFSEDVELRISGNYNINEHDYYIQPKVTYKVSDKLKLKAGLDIMEGHKDTFWGKWRNNDRVFTNVLWYF